MYLIGITLTFKNSHVMRNRFHIKASPNQTPFSHRMPLLGRRNDHPIPARPAIMIAIKHYLTTIPLKVTAGVPLVTKRLGVTRARGHRDTFRMLM